MPPKPDQNPNPMNDLMNRLRGMMGGGGGDENGPNRKKVHFSLWYFLAALLIISWLQNVMIEQQMKKIPYSEFKTDVEKGKVDNIVLEDDRIRGEFKQDGSQAAKQMFMTVRVEDPGLIKLLDEKGVSYTGRLENKWVGAILSWLLPMLIFILFWGFLIKRMGGGAQGVLSVGKAKFKVYAEREIGVTFDDVAGIDEAKQELQEIVEFLRTPDKFRRLGAQIPKGVLIVGAPGTGKTLLAKAVAGEAGVPFFSMSGSEFVEMFVGVGAARVRDLFGQARQQAPCIIFIDELDALGKARGMNPMGGHDEREQTLNQMLVEMDGFDPYVGVIILAATNRPEILDQALLRPGRFDRHVAIDKPDIKGREMILRIHARNIRLDPEVDLKKIAGLTPGFVGADLANLVNEAALLAARRNRDLVTTPDFQDAVDRIIGGLERRNRAMNPREKEIVAYHESGHALIAMSVKNADPVNKITIIPRGIGALGYTQQLPTEDRYLMTRTELIDRVHVLLGGRGAEEVIFGDISTGAQNDLQRATDIARSMIMEYGMSKKLGPLTYGRETHSPFLDIQGTRSREFSEDTAREIDAEIAAIVEEAHTKVVGTLTARRDILEKMAAVLLQKETIEGEDLKPFVKMVKESGEEAGTTPAA